MCIIYAVVNDLLADVSVERIGEFEAALFDYLTAQCPAILENIRDTRQLTKENEALLREAIQDCKAQFLK